MVQGLTLQVSTAGVVGLIPGGGTKIPHAMWHSQQIKKIIIKESPGLSSWKKWKTAIFSRQGFSNPRIHKYQSQDSLYRFLPLPALTWQETCIPGDSDASGPRPRHCTRAAVERRQDCSPRDCQEPMPHAGMSVLPPRPLFPHQSKGWDDIDASQGIHKTFLHKTGEG